MATHRSFRPSRSSYTGHGRRGVAWRLVAPRPVASTKLGVPRSVPAASINRSEPTRGTARRLTDPASAGCGLGPQLAARSAEHASMCTNRVPLSCEARNIAKDEAGPSRSDQNQRRHNAPCAEPERSDAKVPLVGSQLRIDLIHLLLSRIALDECLQRPHSEKHP